MSKNESRISSSLAVATCCVFLLTALPGSAEAVEAASAETVEAASAERFRANVISLGGLRVGGTLAASGTTTADFVVRRFSTEAERGRLLEALKSGGRDELWKTLGKMDPVGLVQVRGSLSYDLRYAREVVSEDGQRLLILATDRPIQFQELRNRTRSRDFDITVVELLLDADGNGSGTAMPAVQVELDPETGDITLVNLNTSPLQLSNVRKTQ